MKDAIGQDGDLEFMGSFVMTGVFSVANAVFTGLIAFPLTTPPAAVPPEENAFPENSDDCIKLPALLRRRQFIIPMLVASILCGAMSMPLSVVRVVMKEVGYSTRQSLTTIEIHFTGMYSPGFVTGALISQFGPKRIALVGIGIFGVSMALTFSADEKEDGESNPGMALWTLGLFFVGVAWNFCFTSATVWTTALYKKVPRLKPKIQAANDFSMFFLSGAWTVSASYIFEAGGNGLEGWGVLNWVVVGLLGLMGLVIGLDTILAIFEQQGGVTLTKNQENKSDTRSVRANDDTGADIRSSGGGSIAIYGAGEYCM